MVYITLSCTHEIFDGIYNFIAHELFDGIYNFINSFGIYSCTQYIGTGQLVLEKLIDLCEIDTEY